MHLIICCAHADMSTKVFDIVKENQVEKLKVLLSETRRLVLVRDVVSCELIIVSRLMSTHFDLNNSGVIIHSCILQQLETAMK